MINIVLYQPEIPPNTGNIMRLSANTGFALHLIEPLGFTLDEKSLRRAGLDYRDMSRVSVHQNWPDFLQKEKPARILALSTKGTTSVFDLPFREGDTVVFGAETSGLSEEFRAQLPAGHILRIPMRENNRSLNLSNAVAVVAYEAWRQLGFKNS